MLLAQTDLGYINGVGSLGDSALAGTGIYAQFTKFLSNIIGFLTIIAGIWFLFQLLLSGYQWISAGGEKQNLQNAQKRMMNALTGILIVVLSYAITGVVGIFLGFDMLNPGNLLYSILP